ncbi:MAG: guanylate kinase [Deltaproteobacteria bacterium]|nr:guanylate kinase [Deltaproteobacteria bacterium]
MTRGDIIVISAPSGSGKTTICRALLARIEGLVLSISYTTREKRTGESGGKDYYYVNEQEFGKMKDCNEFLEYARVYGNWYGTSYGTVDAIVAGGEDAVLEIDVQGGRAVKAVVPEAVLIGILPPDREALRKRLFGRARDSREDMERRLEAAWKEISELREYDYIVVNKDLETAIRQVECIIRARRSRRERTKELVDRILRDKGEQRDGSSNG